MFRWVTPLFLKGTKGNLKLSDIYDCPKVDSSERMGDMLQREWDKELRKQQTGGKPSLIKAAIRSFGFLYCINGTFTLVEECFIHVLQPVLLGYLIEHFTRMRKISEHDVYLYSASVCLLAAMFVFTHHPYFFGAQRFGMRLRVACCSLVYKKSLRLSQSALGKTTVGQMVNLLSNDVNRFDQSVVYLPYLVAGPIQTAIIIGILWHHIDYACLAGISVLLLYIPFQGLMGRWFSKLRIKTAVLTDERIRLMNEIIGGMRVIKMYTWEYPFAHLVDSIRRKEVKKIRHTAILRGVNIALFFVSSKVILFLSFLVYALAVKGDLTPEKVFVSMVLFNNLRLAMTLFFPYAVSQGAESIISLRRIEKFLMLEEQQETSHLNVSNLRPKLSQCGIWMHKVVASWNKDGEATLKNITLQVRPGELLAVVGPVGCGKTSLLVSVLGEVPISSGEIKVRGKISYASQEPWAFGGSVKQNVIFGSNFDEERYKTVLNVCALDKDIELFPYGDSTLVGERGVSLSGGQKARVNLARAMYFDADIFLLDDPLSAVDAAVSKHLFEKCINGYLKDKVRILATHQIQFLRGATQILVLKEGKALALGTYQQLVNAGVDFGSLMEDYEEERRQRLASIASAKSNISAEQEAIPDNATPIPLYESSLSMASSSELSDEIQGEKVIDNAPKSAEEMKSTGAVGLKIYKEYIKSGSGPLLQIILVISYIATQALFNGSDYWLTTWTNDEQKKASIKRCFELYPNRTWIDTVPEDRYSASFNDCSIWTNEFNITSLDAPESHRNLYIYSALVWSVFVLSLIRTTAFFTLCMKASINLHNKMFRCVLRAPVSFFDNNPVGRVLNRFSKDAGIIDETMPMAGLDTITVCCCVFQLLSFLTPVTELPPLNPLPTSQILNRCSRDMGMLDDVLPPTASDGIEIFFNLFGILIVVATIEVWLLLATALLTSIFVLIRKFYLPTARDVKRYEGITRSPVFSHLSTSLYGLTTIRAYKVQRSFEIAFDHHQDKHTSTWFMFIAVTRWFGIVLDWLCVAYITSVTIAMVIAARDVTYASKAGLAIASALQLSGSFQWGVRQSAEVESQMTSVERVIEYSNLKPEAPLESKPDKKPPKEWPPRGTIDFDDVSLQYNEDDPPVLKNLSFSIEPQEKIGIVGRTGAGKSSMIATLFRMTEPDGILRIDGIATKDLGLHDLRKKISIIPQDPVLFTGPVRRNLDPFKEHSDKELWQALDEAHLKESVQELPGGLDTELAEGGTNFSVGQRQLICLARAILRRNKILVLDEATANVDPKTDSLIQHTIRTRFRTCTVLTIAHRLHTIMDSDRVLVLDAGRVKEFDVPYELLQDRNSLFSHMVQMTGPAMAQQLRDIARQAHLNHLRTKDMDDQPKKENVFGETNGDVVIMNNPNILHQVQPNSVHLIVPNDKDSGYTNEAFEYETEVTQL